tara:strand:+ start:761 stop:940 length:180 start_codon:yes stop_codon:yes gene_type:complete
MDFKSKNRIHELLNSDAVNYLETSERLLIKNSLEKNIISQIELNNLEKILKKYAKYLKN